MKVYVKLFAEVNLGDDLFLKILLERYPDVIFIIHAREEYKAIFEKFDNIRVHQIERESKFKRFLRRGASLITRRLLPVFYSKNIRLSIINRYKKDFQSTDVFLSIGGSIFMQPKILPAYADIEYYKIVNKYFKDKIYIGCNFGPYLTDDYKNSYIDIFSEATDVCFRDKKSARIFSDLENVRVKPDIVFGLPTVTQLKIENSIGFSIISPRNGIDKYKYIDKYVELIEYYQAQKYNIFLFSFCSKQKDDETIELIFRRLANTSNINRVYYTGNIDEFLEIYSSIEKMFCSRFHSMILSMLYQQQFIPVIYSQKMTNVLNDISFEGYTVQIEDFYKIQPALVDLEIKKCKYDVSQQVIDSIKQFKELDSVLNTYNNENIDYNSVI